VEKRRVDPKVIIFLYLPFAKKIKMVNLGVSSSKGTNKRKKVEEERLKGEKAKKVLQTKHEIILKEQVEEIRVHEE
jgi:hypothetical protein